MMSQSKRKHPKWVSLMVDKNFKKKAREYVLDNGYIKDKPNLTLQNFVSWVKEKKSVEVCASTASGWLHNMGFSYRQFSKGLYFDGHERNNVVKKRTSYLEMTDEIYCHRMYVSHSPAPNPLSHPITRVFHDESTFYANVDQSFHWSDGTKQALKQKSLKDCQTIMV